MAGRVRARLRTGIASRPLSARADDNFAQCACAGVTSLDVIDDRDADWLRAALTGSPLFQQLVDDVPALYP